MILLFSGGLDSFVAYHYLNKPQTVYFDLRTPYSNREKKVILDLIPETIVDYSLILNDRQIGEKAYIPFRNLYLAMLANKYSDEIVIAGLKDDVVSDKNEFIFQEVSNILSKMESRSIKVHSPFWNLTKEEVVRWYLNNSGSEEELLKTISCYDGEELTNYCGKCPSCFRKWNALRANGVDIKFWNDELMSEYYQLALDGKYILSRNLSIVREIDAYRS